MVDGVQVNSSGSYEKSNPLQLPLSNIIQENNVIGEVDTAEGLQRSSLLAGDQDATVLGLDSHSLRYGAMEVFHRGKKIYIP